MRIGRLHVLTDASIQSRFDHVQLAAMAVRGGADVIQYRRKDGSTRELIREALRIREITRRARIPLIINDRVDVALATDADGVHLGTEDFPIAIARRLLGPHRILGGPGGSIGEAREGAGSGADYLGCGPIYATSTKPDAGNATGPTLLRDVAKIVEIPLIAIGGITHDNAAEVLQAGAHGIAVVSFVCASSEPEEATRALRRIIDAVVPRGSR
jgi:thiamine-phosphate pyrophosphorylase